MAVYTSTAKFQEKVSRIISGINLNNYVKAKMVSILNEIHNADFATLYHAKRKKYHSLKTLTLNPSKTLLSLVVTIAGCTESDDDVTSTLKF